MERGEIGDVERNKRGEMAVGGEREKGEKRSDDDAMGEYSDV